MVKRIVAILLFVFAIVLFVIGWGFLAVGVWVVAVLFLMHDSDVVCRKIAEDITKRVFK